MHTLPDAPPAPFAVPDTPTDRADAPPIPQHLLGPQPNALTITPPPPSPEEASATILATSLLGALHNIQMQPYLEQLARTDPSTFHKWAALILGRKNPGGDKNNVVNNIVMAVPRSALDDLPRGFDLHK